MSSRNLGPGRSFVGYGANPPDPQWPGGVRLAVNLVINYEEGAEYTLGQDGTNDTWGESAYTYGPQVRDLGNESDMEFGSRVGVWRLCRILDEFGVDATFSVCARALELNEELCAWLMSRGHDVQGHGYRWYGPDTPALAGHDRDAEREEIALAVASVQRTTGQRIRGWNVRSFPTVHTRELLLEEGGFIYDSDSVNDELPYYDFVDGEPFLVVPYTRVFNDTHYFTLPAYATPRHFFENLKVGLDYLLGEASRSQSGRMMSVGLHPRWSGQVNRASAVRDFVSYASGLEGVAFVRRLDIAEHWLEVHQP